MQYQQGVNAAVIGRLEEVRSRHTYCICNVENVVKQENKSNKTKLIRQQRTQNSKKSGKDVSGDKCVTHVTKKGTRRKNGRRYS
jgi:hypothetical protein